jgi:hypothetical protein
MVMPEVKLDGNVEAKLTTPVLLLYVPAPNTALVTVTLPRPGEICSVSVGLMAALVLKLLKLTAPDTSEPTGAELAGMSTRVLRSAAKGETEALAVVLAALVSFNALVVAVICTAALGWL